MTGKIQLQNMIVDLVRVLIEASEGINVIVPTIRYRCIDQARRALTKCAGDLWPIAAIDHGAVFHRGVRHDEGIVGRD